MASIEDSGSEYKSKIETVEGNVELSDLSHKSKIFVAKNQAASYVTDKGGLFSNAEKADFIAKGYLTPVYQMNDEEIAKLNRETDFDLKSALNNRREVGPEGEATKNLTLGGTVETANLTICTLPSAELNQCSWICENNPAGEKTCRTDLPKVSCTRRICNANGKWSSPTRLPASFHDSCKADKPLVGPCDY